MVSNNLSCDKEHILENSNTIVSFFIEGQYTQSINIVLWMFICKRIEVQFKISMEGLFIFSFIYIYNSSIFILNPAIYNGI